MTTTHTVTAGHALTVDEYRDFGELIDQAENGTSDWNAKCRTSRNAGAEWSGTPDFAAAIDLARYGWKEGRDKLAANLDAAAAMQPAITRAQNYDVAGAYPDVPRFLGGAPDCMISFGDDAPQKKPIVRLLLQRFVSCSVSAEAIINQGVAILSYADQLEQAGYSVEIACVMRGVMSDGAAWKQEIRWTAKRAGEPMELDRLAFIIAHPSLFRRILFSLNEQTTHTHRGQWSIDVNRSYWGPTDAPAVEPGQVYFAQPSEGKWQTLRGAMQAVAEMLLTAGIAIDDPNLNR